MPKSFLRGINDAEVDASVQLSSGDQERHHRGQPGKRTGFGEAAEFPEQMSALPG